MSKKKKKVGPEGSEAQEINEVTGGDAAVEGLSADAVPSIPDFPAMPDVPPPPSAGMEPPPPPPRTSGMRAYDMPPLHGGAEGHSPDAAKGVLKGILERSRDEVDNEAAALMGALKVQQDAQRMARDEEDRRRAAEARARVEEERRKREAALKEYEARQRAKEEAARPKVQVAETTSMAAQKKGGKGWIAAVVVIVLAAAGGVAWFLMPHVDPVAFAADSSLERAQGGMILSAPVAYGPQTLRPVRTPDAGMLVAAVAPAVYEAPAPAPLIRKGGGGQQNRPTIEIRTGIIGGSKVIH